MNWDIYTLGGGAYLQVIFNAIAAMAGSGDYLSLLKLAMIAGVLITLARSAYKGQMFDWQWLLGATMTFYVAFVPTATVIITDNLDPSQSSIVSNVPLGLAATAGIADQVGWWLTDEYDSLMTIPSDLTYDKHGMLFGNALVDATLTAEISDPRTAQNLSEFFQQCVYYDLLLGKYSLSDLQSATDMWAFIQSNTSSARAFSYQPSAGASTIEICTQSAMVGGDLNNDLQAALPQTLNILGYNLVQADNRTDAISTYMSDMPIAFQYFTGLSNTASSIVSQATLANAMKRGISDWASRSGASAAAQDYAAAVAEEQQKTTYQVAGRVAQKVLPLLNNLLKAGIYAIFPIAFALVLLPGGYKAALMYMKALIWIELWSPLFAIVHFLATLTTAAHAKGAITLGDGTQVLSMLTYSGLGQVMADYSIIAGYCTLLVPPLAWAIVAGGGAIASSAVQSILSSYAGAAQQAAGEATRGNVSLGNTSFGNASWWQQNQAPSMAFGTGSMTGSDGIKHTTTTGGVFNEFPMSKMPLSAGIEASTRAAVAQGATSASRAAYTDTVEASSRVGRSLTEVEQLQSQLSRNQDFRDGVNKSLAGDFSQSSDQLFSMLDQIRSGTNYSRQQAAQLALDAGAGVSLAGGAGIPGVPQARAGGNANFSGHLNESDQASVTKALDNMKAIGADKSFSERLASTLRAGAEVASSYGGTDSRSYADGVSSQLSHDAAIASRASASIERARGYEEARRLTQDNGFGSKIQLDDRFQNWLIGQMGGDRHSAEALIRDGAQTGNAAAFNELSGRMREFSTQYADDIARSAGISGGGEVEQTGEGWQSNVRSAGAVASDSLAALGRTAIHGAADGAEAQGLTTGEIDSQITSTRTAAASESDRLRSDALSRSAQTGLDRMREKETLDKERNFDRNTPLTLQVFGTGRIDSPDAGKPIVNVPDISGIGSGQAKE